MRNKDGFTLIELLVVIAIIGILASILFPVFAKAKLAAKASVCLSNQGQIGKAFILYCDEYDQRWCPTLSYAPEPPFSSQQTWLGYDNRNGNPVDRPARYAPKPGGLDPYIRNEAVKKCPAMPDGWQMTYCANWWNTVYDSPYYYNNPAARGNEYGPGTKTVGYVGGVQVDTGASMSEIAEPSTTLCMWEHHASVNLCWFIQPYDWFWSPPNLQILRDHFHFLHFDGALTLWVDGHVRRMTYGQLRRPMFSCRKDIYPVSL